MNSYAIDRICLFVGPLVCPLAKQLQRLWTCIYVFGGVFNVALDTVNRSYHDG